MRWTSTLVFRMFGPTQAITFLALAVFAGAVSADPIINVLAGAPQQFGEMDLATGTFSPIGPVPATIQYLAPGPNGSLLTMSFNGDLVSINRTTGATAVVGPTGFSDCSTPSTPSCGPNSQLSFGAAGGVIYATDFANNLYTVNPATGRATLVGTTGIPAVPFIPAATNPDGSFNIYNENLFGAGGNLYANFDAGTLNPETSVLTIVISPALYQIDAGTGHATRVASTDFGLITIFNLSGTVYGFNGATSQVVTLNVTNGTTSFASDIDPSAGLIAGAAPAIPEPASIALSMLGLVLVVFWRRQRIRP